MSFALSALSALLSPDSSQLGSVVGVTGSMARVATARGAVLVHSTSPLSVGDRVQIKNGIASKSPVARQAFPV
jgi:hypothetical protein